jgi:hypothetical protein
MTMGAPPKCVTLCCSIASYSRSARTQRVHTCVLVTDRGRAGDQKGERARE